MSKKSAGIVMYRFKNKILEVFLVHPGGPFWSNKDKHVWSIPKGEFDEGENILEAAKREFQEETGFEVDGNFTQLQPVKQPSRKIIYAWTVESDCDASAIKSNTFPMEWPPKSGKQQEFPEVDKADWFTIGVAKEKIFKGQVGFLEQLCNLLGYDSSELVREKTS